MRELLEIIENFRKSPLRFLKNNLNLIIILPALFGGLWQVIELSMMSFSFIRFFSVGQIIPDGLLILMFLIIFLISAFSLIFVWKKFDSGDGNGDDVFIPKKGNIFIALLYFILFVASIILIIFSNNYFIESIESIFSLFFYVPANIVITLFSFVFINYSIMYCKDLDKLIHFKKVISNLSFLPITIQSAMFMFFAVQFHDVFMLPLELRNVENLICKMEKIDESSNIEILYSNDKYVFVECHQLFSKDRNGNPIQSEIRIFRFEDLLDDTACIGSKRIRAQFVKDSIWDSKRSKVLNDTIKP